MKKILYGIGGIGTGHSYRQLSIVNYLSRRYKLVVLAYGESYRIYKSLFKKSKSVSVLKIDVPFISGDKKGLSFKESSICKYNRGKDFFTINSLALSRVQKLIGKPDLVVSDYEPVSASYSYVYGSPLVTLDQQSKYLVGDFSKLAPGSFADEVMRLSMFFPKAEKRIACSFFRVSNLRKDRRFDVEIVPSTIKDEILSLNRKPSSRKEIIIYLSSQREFRQTNEEIINLCRSMKDIKFHLFVKGISKNLGCSNVKVYDHGQKEFYKVLSKCNGIITTAGHMLLSEAMYLGIPVYAMPLDLYEQRMNAFVIAKNKFGVLHPILSKKKLELFIDNLDLFRDNIEKERKARKVLLLKPGQEIIIPALEKILWRSS